MQTKQVKREKAVRLAQYRAGRTAQQQLFILDERLGKDQGAVKERARLQSLINKGN